MMNRFGDFSRDNSDDDCGEIDSLIPRDSEGRIDRQMTLQVRTPNTSDCTATRRQSCRDGTIVK